MTEDAQPPTPPPTHKELDFAFSSVHTHFEAAEQHRATSGLLHPGSCKHLSWQLQGPVSLSWEFFIYCLNTLFASSAPSRL